MKKLIGVLLIAISFVGCIKIEQSVVVASQKTPVVNLNTASAAELDELKGLGKKKVAKVINHRLYRSKFELLERGIIEKLHSTI